ncbi:MAG: thiamine pyrophosphate-dependent enzyme, partial [Burkholderiales bacterium]|nr:thiamine pyrophosphate-dependent enzyme [Burkholderiales bacterium]
RYQLPIITVIFNNNGVYKGCDPNLNPKVKNDVAVTAFVKGARYDKMMEAFGGTGYNVTTPAQMTKALTEAIAAGKPALINAVIDEAAGAESGRLINLNPKKGALKK